MYSNVRACCCVPGSVLIYCCCCSCCRSSSCVGWQNVFPWFTASDLSVSFPFIQTPLFNTPVGGTVAFSASIFLPVIPTIHPRYYGHAQSQGGRQAAATDTPLYTRYIYTSWYTVHTRLRVILVAGPRYVSFLLHVVLLGVTYRSYKSQQYTSVLPLSLIHI